MSDFLERMAVASARRAGAARAELAVEELRALTRDRERPPPLTLSGEGFDVIAEVKRRSPAEGTLAVEGGQSGAGVLDRASAYTRAGAAAVSVLTEPERFEGSPDDLREAVATGAPVLRKDFLVEPYQVWEAAAWGASGVLLIVRMLSDDGLRSMLDACQQARLFALVESFDEADLERAARVCLVRAPEPGLLMGVNARDLTTLRVAPGRLVGLAGALPSEWPAVAESGLLTERDVAAVAGAGYRLALVGTALMRAEDPEVALTRMIEAGRTAVRQGAAP